MNGPIRRVARILGIVFLVLVLGLTYWQAMAADQLRRNPGNSRVELTRSGQERGEIISADTVVLARSVPDRDPGSFRRVYLHGSAYAHVVGFSTALFGDRGVEATHASILRSRRDLTTSGILNAMLGDDLRPHSIQLTLNHELQSTAARALGGRSGAVVALDPTNGRILALVSAPSFDPNVLVGSIAAAEWEALTERPDRPLDNRAIGGSLSLSDLLSSEVPLILDDLDPASALGVAARVAAATQGGLMMRPHVAARVFDADSNRVSQTEPQPMSAVFGSEASQSLYGESLPLTLGAGRVPPEEGAGNSGVAETERGEPAAWFFGVWPATDPNVVVAVVIDPGPDGEAGQGRSAAASIGRSVLAVWIDLLDGGNRS